MVVVQPARLLCSECSHSFKNHKTLRTHMIKKHGWVSTCKPGRPPKQPSARASTAPTQQFPQRRKAGQPEKAQTTKAFRRRRRWKLIGTASCGKPDSSSFAVDCVDLRTPSPVAEDGSTRALLTPPSSVGKAKITAPTWSAVNGKTAEGARSASLRQLPIHTRFDDTIEDVDEITWVPSEELQHESVKGKKRERLRKRKLSVRARTQPPQRNICLLSETPPEVETLATPPPTPPSAPPTRTDKGKGAIRKSSRPSATGPEYEVIPRLESGFDRFLAHGLEPEGTGEEDGSPSPPKRYKHSEDDRYMDRLFSDLQRRKQQKTSATPKIEDSRYAARVEDMSSEDEKTRQSCLKAGATYNLKTRESTATVQQRRSSTVAAYHPAMRFDAPEKEPDAEELHAQSPERLLAPEKKIALAKAGKSDLAGFIEAAKAAVDANKVEETRSLDRGTMTEPSATIDATTQVELPADAKPIDIKPAVLELSGDVMALLPALLPVLTALQRAKLGEETPDQHGSHDGAVRCEVCHILTTVLHGLHRGGMLGSCCSHK